MDARQIAEHQLVERYLAGRLTDDEANAFEAYVESHPELIRDIEEVARMKSGLAVLQRRGELPTFLKRRDQNWLRRPALIAAAIVGVAVGLLVFWPAATQKHDGALIAASIQGLVGDDPAPSLISAVLLSRTRSLTPETLHASPQASLVQVTIELFAEDTSSRYSVQLMQSVDGRLEPLAQLKDVRANSEGNLVLYALEDSLAGGNYVFRVTEPGEEQPSDFTLRIARAE